MSNAACVDYSKVGFFGGFDRAETELFEELANLLAFVLIDFAAKSIYGKSLHNKI